MGTLAGLVPKLDLNQDTPMKDTTRANGKSYTVWPVLEAPDVFRESSTEAARRHIDLDILRLEESIRALKSKRNNLAAIAKLPAELLSKIFTLCAADSILVSANHTHLSQPSIAWIKVTHVSRHWRAVALSCPSLWSRIVLSQPRWAEEMLKRSKMASLVIRAGLGVTTPKILDVVQAALRQMSRARELHIAASVPTMEKVFRTPPTSAPFLRSLILAGPRPYYGGDYAFVIPEKFLCEGTPSLRRLELTQCDFQWNSQFLRGLEDLKIQGVSNTARPTTQQLLDMLGEMPGLKTLHLFDCLPVYDEALSLNHIVELSSLTSIGVTSTVLECTNLLQHISFPPTATIQLTCNTMETDDHPFSSILTILEDRFKIYDTETSCPPIRTLDINTVLPDRLQFSAWPNALSVVENSLRSPPDDASMELIFTWRSSVRSNTVMADVCAVLPISHLRVLRVMGSDDIDKATWAETFGHLTKLRTVNVSQNSAHALVGALLLDRLSGDVKNEEPNEDLDSAVIRPIVRRKKSIPLPPICFPSLQKLCINLADFDIDNTEYFFQIDDLVDCLMERYERGAEVRELALVECKHLGYEHVDKLREIVVDVNWDEVEYGFSGSDDEVEDLLDLDIGYLGGYAHSDYFDSDEDMFFG